MSSIYTPCLKKTVQPILCSVSVKHKPISIKNRYTCTAINMQQNCVKSAYFTYNVYLHYLGKFEVTVNTELTCII